MSLRQLKHGKARLNQLELRKLMNQQKQLQEPTQKITSPLAKYNELGQLTCVLCKTVVRSESVWNVHINAKLHKQNVEEAKQLKEKLYSLKDKAAKRPNEDEDPQSKKLKGILKNGTSKADDSDKSMANGKSTLPSNFFDKPKSGKNDEKNESTKPEDGTTEPPSTDLPEGFFDDPQQDAKARNIQYKDPVEEEWEKFQKEIKDADHKSAAIIAEEDEVTINARQIDEIDEQIQNWSRVLNLERKKEEILKIKREINDEDEEMDDDDAEDVDEYFDWRAKKSYK